ncbi:phosphodiesterase [Cryobacterium arcticum]|uniref:3'''',5''''-cyclic-nucleotide phosphodiesterase n=1 Tax=Cryobacterium arcticum TaxID=670052 RepID=A0A1B1BM62_9MICO|nr:phosphodiesterase [Cryobacterium arcticum]ANP73638.1 3'''',5''''-cyclic-nucleotide phosphodiesterase [Cryobacterium arcticum]
MSIRTAEYPRPDYFLLHLSDTHLLADGNRLYGSVDSAAHVQRLFADVEASGSKPDAIIITGDLADKGEPHAYAQLRGIVEPAAARLGAKVLWVMGNHDNRANFRTELLGQEPSLAPIDHVDYVGGLRIITFDTTVPGSHYGEISERQLEWLSEQLSFPAPDGTILAMHHPPVPSMLDLSVSVELRDQASLAQVLRGTDVRSILAGHLHYSSTATFAGIPVSVASATCYTQDLNVPVGGTRGRDGARAFNLVHVYADTVLHSVVPLGDFEALDYIDPAESARRLAASGIEIMPAGSLPAYREPPMTRPIPVLR